MSGRGVAVLPALLGAVDVGATKTLVAVARRPLDGWSPAGRVVRVATPPEPAALVEVLSETLAILARDAGEPLVSVGIGAPGPLDAAGGVILHSPNQGWRGVPLGPLLADRAGVPVALDDDANLGALGEARLGAGRGVDPVVYVTVSTGIGAGIVVHGRVVRGAHGAGGEVGHLVVDPAGPRCGCGHRGCVEAYAAGGGLERRARAVFRGRPRPGGTGGPWQASDVFRAARAADPAAVALVRDGEAALARAFAALTATVDPGRIVVGGAIGLAQLGYIRRAAQGARRLTIAAPGSGSGPDVVRAELPGQSALAGAAVLADSLAAAGGGAGTGGGPARSVG